jgi:hypothetical protein
MQTVRVKFKDSLYLGDNKPTKEIVVPVAISPFVEGDGFYKDVRKTKAAGIVKNGVWFMNEGRNIFVSPNEISYVTWDD